MPLRQLVDEAELAVVVARAHPVEHARSTPRRRAARRLALVTIDRELEAAASDVELQLRLVDQERHSMTSRGTCPFSRTTSSPGTSPRARRGGAGRDSGDDGRGHGAPGYRRPAAVPARRHR